MVPEWLAVPAMIFTYIMGAVTWYAIAKRDDPFWGAFLDGLTMGFWKH